MNFVVNMIYFICHDLIFVEIFAFMLILNMLKDIKLLTYKSEICF